MEDYDHFNITIPKKTISWNGTKLKNGKVISNKDVFATKEEIEKILNFLKESNFKHYLIIKVLVETGARKGEIINAKLDDLNIEERYINTKTGKTGAKYYYFSESLGRELELYLNARNNIKTENEYLFLTKFFDKYSTRNFNAILKKVRERVGIKTNITCHTFRRTVNDLRKTEMKCPNEDRRILLGHKTSDVNVANYTKSDIITIRKLFDTYNPYKDLNI